VTWSDRLGDEPQPDGFTYGRPEWGGVLKPSQAEIAAMAEWIAQQDFEPHDLPSPKAASASYEEMERYLGALPEITAEEERAVLRGAELRRRGETNPWKDLLTCLRADSPTPHFLSVVADLIEGNALHNRGAIADKQEGTVTPAEARRRHEGYVGILKRNFPGKKMSAYQQRAFLLIASEVRKNGEAFDAALKRVQNAKRRKPDPATGAIDAAVSRIRMARIRPTR
jgi:hypothetical protein